MSHGNVRPMGVEEEFLLVDGTSGLLLPVGGLVVDACQPHLQSRSDTAPQRPVIQHEFFLEQVESATPPCRSAREAASQLSQGRRLIADAAALHNAVALPVALPLIEHVGGTPTRERRYEQILQVYGAVAEESLMCATHIHVQTDSDEESVGVVDRLRPWLPVLLAISANSPFHQGKDTRYDSWRSRIWEMWPTSGSAEPLGTPETYRDLTGRLVEWGAALDPATINFGTRLSVRYPTVEVRVSDVCLDSRDTLLLAVLIRALVTTVAREWHQDVPQVPWLSTELRAAHWQAARFGVTGPLVHPAIRALAPTKEIFTSLMNYVADGLGDDEDVEVVESGLARLLSVGNGADHQRRALRRTGSLLGVLHEVRLRAED